MKNLLCISILLAATISIARPAIIEDPIVTDKKTKKFMIETVDMGILMAQQGRLAAQRSNTLAIREYGALIMQDQLMILEHFRKLAAEKNVAVPSTLSDEKGIIIRKLENADPAQFDKMFMKMMQVEIQENIHAFTKSTTLKDADVQKLVHNYLSTFRLHLAGWETVKQSFNSNHLPA